MASLTVFDLSQQRDPKYAAPLLAQALRRGELFLILGAGVSKPLGLPDWGELVDHAVRIAGCQSGDSPETDDYERMDVVRRHLTESNNQTFEDVVAEALYGPSPAAFTLDDMRQPLLLALGAMLMPSKSGSVTEVMNFNFDDVLETYLRLYGFETQAAVDSNPMIRGDVDVVVFHPHGYIPATGNAGGSAVVLSQSQYTDRLAGKDRSSWPTIIQSRLLTKTFVSVGFSMRDQDFLVNLKSVQTSRRGPFGYVIGVHSDDDIRRISEDQMVPVCVDDYDGIPDFLFEVCRIARRPS